MDKSIVIKEVISSELYCSDIIEVDNTIRYKEAFEHIEKLLEQYVLTKFLNTLHCLIMEENVSAYIKAYSQIDLIVKSYRRIWHQINILQIVKIKFK